MYSGEPQKAVLKIKGEKEVKGSDFKFPTQVELINKSCHIATLTEKKAELEMEIQIEKGIGYSPVEQRKKKEKMEIGVMPIDAIFTPVKRVSYKVEDMRVGERTDFDRLRLEVETDGTIAPEEALFKASEILKNHFFLLEDAFAPKAEIPQEGPTAKPKKTKKAKVSAKKKTAKKSKKK